MTFYPETLTTTIGEPSIANEFRPGGNAEVCIAQSDADRRPFPVAALPSRLQEFVRGVSILTRTPLGLVACCALGTLSAAIRKGLRVQSLPGKTAPANLYILVGAPSGTGKSLAYSEVVTAMTEYETLQGALRDDDVDGADSNATVAQSAIYELQSRLEDPSTSDGAKAGIRAEIQELNHALKAVKNERRLPRLACEETTPAGLIKILAEDGQAECVASLSPDARDIANRLSASNQSSRATLEGIFLKAYTEDPHQVDRANKDAIRLRRPNITCLWLVQPDLMHQLFVVTKLTEGGLLPRFLVHRAECEPRPIDRATQILPDDVRSRWKDLVTSIVEQYGLAAETLTIQPENEAIQLMDQHYRVLVERRGADLSDVSAYASRWNENAWRIALVLHTAELGALAHEKTLSAKTAGDAITIIDWFAAEQLEVLDASREAVFRESAKQVRQLLEAKRKGITTRDITRARICSTGNEAKPLLERMVSERLLRREVIPPLPGKGGKTQIVYHLA